MLAALQGEYLVACVKMLDMLQDSGWALKKEGEEESDSPDDSNPLSDVPTVGSYSGML